MLVVAPTPSMRSALPAAWVTAPPVVSVRPPDSVMPPSTMAPVSFKRTLRAERTATVPKSSAPSSVTSLPPAVMVVVPVTLSTPLSVSAPPTVTVRFPDRVVAPRSSALASTSVALRARLIDRAPPKSLPARSSVMSLDAPARSVVAPAMVRAEPIACAMEPPAVADRVPALMVPNSRAFRSASVTPAAVTLTAPVKSFAAWSSTTVPPFVATMVVVPAMVRAALSVMDPPAFSAKSPVAAIPARSSPSRSRIVTALPSADSTSRSLFP